MYVANTHLKPVIGIDIHFVNTPIPFIPLPHPYIGLVIDPFDYIPFIGATVSVNNVPRGNTDTTGMIITFIHIPFGVGFSLVPVIGHDSQNFFGSKTVQIDGAPMSGAGYILMTCNDIGLPLSFRPGKKFKPIPSLYLPTSFCIPLQWGKPVVVGGPMVPHFSLMALLKAFAFGSFLKIFGKLGGKLLKALNHKVLKKSPATNKLSKLFCKMGFEPVDLVTGRVNYEYTDFELPGAIPVKWERSWDSDSRITGPLGHGVQFCYDRYIQLWPEEECLSVVLADGRLAVFPLLYHGESFYHPHEKLMLRRKQNGHFLLEDYNDSCYYHFNHDADPGRWQLSFIEDCNGSRVQLHYSGKHLQAITDSVGRQLLFTLDKQHRITQVEVKHRDVSKILVSYGYNEHGDLVSIADALNQVTTIEYRYHLMIKKTDRNGQSFYWEYDSKRRCIHTWGDGGVLEGYIQYRKGYNEVTNSLGETTLYHYDENNLCIQETDHYGNHRYTEYTDNIELYRDIDEAGNIEGYAYDDRSRLIENISADGSSTKYHYNEFNQPVLIINPDGTSQTFGYDNLRRLCFINHPNGRSITLQYNTAGQVECIVENGKLKTLLKYDEDANLTNVQLPDGTVAEWKYDALGRCIQSVNPNGQIRYITYDELDRIQTIHLPDGNTIKLQYNAYEDIVLARDKHTTVQYEYTPLGNVKKRKQGNDELQFLFDTEERLCAVINESGRQYRLGYNKRGEIISETGFDGIQSNYERDVIGRITKAIRPGARSTNYEYDVNGNITRIEYHDGSWELFNYDKNGDLREAINEHSAVRFTRNKRGMIICEDQDGYKVESTYDKWGNRIRLTSSLGADMLLRRNESGAVTNMQIDAWQAKMKYNEAGAEIERILPGGLSTEWKYDQGGRPEERKVSRKGVVQSWKKYTWDSDTKLTDLFDALSQGNTHFKHDQLGNLVFAQYANNSILHRTADATGNIYETTDKSDRRYNSAGAPLESRKYLYKYDEEGFLVSKTDKVTQKKTRYTWYANGMLKKVIGADGKTIQFTYDALGRRISKSCNGTLTRWVWHANVPLHEWSYDENEKPRAVVNEWGEMTFDKEEPNPQNKRSGANGITWVFDDDSFVPCAKIEDGNAYSIITDHLGTPVEAYDDAGKKVWECVLDIYGRALMINGSKNFIPFRFQGQYEDEETGLYYNRYRYYNPGEGLYISKDPLSVLGGFNVYSYAHDPNSWIDAWGLANNTPIGDAAENHLKAVLKKQNWKIFPDIKNGSENGLDIVAQHPRNNKVYVFEVKANTSRLSDLQKDPEKYIADRLTEARDFGTICGKQTPPGTSRAARQILREIDKHGMRRYVVRYKVKKVRGKYVVTLKPRKRGVKKWVKCP